MYEKVQQVEKGEQKMREEKRERKDTKKEKVRLFASSMSQFLRALQYHLRFGAIYI